MNSVKCAKCGLVNFAEDKFCKRCDSELLLPQPINCPICQYTNAPEAKYCVACNRVFNFAPPVPQTYKTGELTLKNFLLIMGIISIVPVLCIVSAMINPPSNRSTSRSLTEEKQISEAETRRKFAFGLETMVDESKAAVRNVRITSEGFDEDVLVFTADGVTARDCQSFAYSDWGKTSAAVGFRKFTCRNRISDGEWTLNLYK